MLRQSLGQGADGFVDESGSVIDCAYFDSAQAWLNLFDFGFDSINDLSRILAESHHDQATDRLSPVQVDGSPSKLRPQLDVTDIPDPKWNAVTSSHNGLFDVLDRFVDVLFGTNKTSTTDNELHPPRFNGLGSDIDVRLPNGVNQLIERNVVKAKPIRIDFDLILTDVAADAGNFAHTRYGLQLILDDEILNAP